LAALKPLQKLIFPHLHSYQTARLEEFCRLLIEEFGVQPEREDAMAVLEENLKVFKTHKTW
jgi:hypothetical protein